MTDLSKTRPDKWAKLVAKTAEVRSAELEIWRKRYPLMAESIAEEARAKVEGREPRYPQPWPLGAA